MPVAVRTDVGEWPGGGAQATHERGRRARVREGNAAGLAAHDAAALVAGQRRGQAAHREEDAAAGGQRLPDLPREHGRERLPAQDAARVGDRHARPARGRGGPQRDGPAGRAMPHLDAGRGRREDRQESLPAGALQHDLARVNARRPRRPMRAARARRRTTIVPPGGRGASSAERVPTANRTAPRPRSRQPCARSSSGAPESSRTVRSIFSSRCVQRAQASRSGTRTRTGARPAATRSSTRRSRPTPTRSSPDGIQVRRSPVLGGGSVGGTIDVVRLHLGRGRRHPVAAGRAGTRPRSPANVLARKRMGRRGASPSAIEWPASAPPRWTRGWRVTRRRSSARGPAARAPARGAGSSIRGQRLQGLIRAGPHGHDQAGTRGASQGCQDPLARRRATTRREPGRRRRGRRERRTRRRRSWRLAVAGLRAWRLSRVVADRIPAWRASDPPTPSACSPARDCAGGTPGGTSG